MSSVTGVWNEIKFRKMCENIIAKSGLNIDFSQYSIRISQTTNLIGQYSNRPKELMFSSYFFDNFNYPEIKALFVVYHEVAHLITAELNLNSYFEPELRTSHGPAWRFACSLIGAHPRAYDYAGKKTVITKEQAELLYNAAYIDKDQVHKRLNELIEKSNHIYSVKSWSYPEEDTDGEDILKCSKCGRELTVCLPMFYVQRQSPFRPIQKTEPAVKVIPPKQIQANKYTNQQVFVFSAVSTFLLLMLCGMSFFVSSAQAFCRGNAPGIFKLFDIGLASLSPIVRALLTSLIIHIPLIPMACILMNDKDKPLSDSALSVQIVICLLSVIAAVIVSSVILFSFSGLHAGYKWISVMIYAAFEIFTLFSLLAMNL